MESGGIAGLVGTDNDAPADNAGGESGLDPTAAALAAEAFKTHPELATEAAAYFRKQGHLVDIQTEHLHEQRAVNLSLLKLRRIAERLKVALQFVAAMAGVLVAIVLLRMVWSASSDRELVVEAFSVPPDLAARGITGQVMASQILDKLGEINAKANSSRLPSSYAAHWAQQAKVEIPETGLSLAELQRFFREWLGHETHITGDVIRTPEGLALTIRAGESGGQTVRAAENELSTLALNAAEAAFQSTQPYRFSWYLRNTGRPSEMIAVLRKLAAEAPTVRERAWALAGLCGDLGDLGDLAGSIQAGRAAIATNASPPVGLLNLAQNEYFDGEDELSLQHLRQALLSLDTSAEDVAPDAVYMMRLGNRAIEEDFLGDFQAATNDYRDAVAGPRFENVNTFAPLAQAYEMARNHDVSGSLAVSAHQSFTDVDAIKELDDGGEEYVANYERDIAVEDWTGAVADIRDAIAAAPQVAAQAPIAISIFLKPRLAYALSRAGQQVEAETIAASLPMTCYRCARTRAWVASMARDWSRADREFANAVRQAPSLPGAYADWGASLLQRGDSQGAIKKLALAHQKGPRYPDVLELWGEALVAKGDVPSALTKFESAAAFSPRWGHLQLEWAKALLRTGQASAAATHRATAATMDLSAADRKALLQI